MTLNESISKIHFKYLCDFFCDIKAYPYAIIKGEALSVLAYRQPSARHLGDIDILSTNKNLNILTDYLRRLNFYPIKSSRVEYIMLVAASHQIKPWIRDIQPWGKIEVDLNFDVFWGEYEGKRIDIEKFLSDTVEMEIYGVKVKTLPPLKAMIQLVLHHYKDMNSLFLLATRKSIRYDMFKDLYYLLKNNLNAIPLDKLYALSSEYEIIPYMFYVLYYTGQVFEDDVLKQYTEAFRTPEGEALLNCYGLCEKERCEWRCDFKTRLDSDNLYELIKNDLTERDKEKIALNKRVFLGINE